MEIEAFLPTKIKAGGTWSLVSVALACISL